MNDSTKKTHKTIVAQHPALAALVLAPLFAALVWYLRGKPDVLSLSLAIMAGCALVAVAMAEIRLVLCGGLPAWIARVLWDAAWFAAVLGALFPTVISLWGCVVAGLSYAIIMALLQNMERIGENPTPQILLLLPTLSLAAGVVLALFDVPAAWTVWVMFVLLCLPQRKGLSIPDLALQHWLWAAVFGAATLTAAFELVVYGA